MKLKKLKVSKPCTKNWNTMSPNTDGRFCDLCSKTVIDFTQLSSKEISKKIKASKGDICAKLTKTQLKMPILDIEKPKHYSLPYSKFAAGVMLAASITSVQSCNEKPNTLDTHLVANNNSPFNSSIQNIEQRKADDIKKNVTVFKGKIALQESKPLENVKVTFVTLSKLYSTYTNKNGHFNLELPNEIIEDKNVVRISFHEIHKNANESERQQFEFYETDDLVISRNQLSNDFKFTPKNEQFILGGIGQYDYESKNNPLIIIDGAQVSFEEFQKSRFGEKSTCSIENKSNYHFEKEAAMALAGDKAKFGLYLLFSID